MHVSYSAQTFHLCYKTLTYLWGFKKSQYRIKILENRIKNRVKCPKVFVLFGGRIKILILDLN